MKQFLKSPMRYLRDRREISTSSQSGINMVDLMMWLVIAALLLAAAIQGVGYYQKAAYLYHVKNDVMGGASRVLSVSGVDHQGKIDESIVGEGLDITDTTKDVALEEDTDPNGNPMIRGTHPGIPDKEVIYLFHPYGEYSDGQVYIVSPGEIPSGSAADEGNDGDGRGGSGDDADALNPDGKAIPGTIPGDGDADSDGTPNSEDNDMDNDGTLNVVDDDMDGDGVSNTHREEFGLVADDVYAGETASYTNGDGSVTTWNYDDDKAYEHSHGPIAWNVLGEGAGEITRIQRGDSNTIYATYSTDGTVDSADGALGGTFYLYMHVDLTCKQADGTTINRYYGRRGTSLDAWYLNVTGPPERLSYDLSMSCETGETILAATISPMDEAHSTARDWEFTRDIVVRWDASPDGIDVVE